jgi:radical SAM superfamily enzyme YgiQ (UPF0313 family)
MRHVLVYNFSGDLDDISHLFPNERLGRIAAVLLEAGCRVQVIDRANLDDLAAVGKDYLAGLGDLDFAASSEPHRAQVLAERDRLLALGPDLLLLNLWHGTGFKFSIDLARALKAARPELPIVGVGQKVDWYREHILALADSGLDGLVTGLGYDAVRHLGQGGTLADATNAVLRSSEGLHLRPSRLIDVNDYPVANYDRTVYTTIAGKAPVCSVTLSNQACPNECVFCVRRENYGRANVRRPTAAVVDEIEALVTDGGVRHFRIEDSTPPQLALSELAQALLDRGLAERCRFSGFSRVDTNAREDFALLKAAGFLALFFGIESLDDGMLEQVRKGTDYQAIQATLRAAHEGGIHTVGSFIFPLPGETRRSLETTLARLRELRPFLDAVVAGPAGVYPHTDWGQHPERYGITLAPDYLHRAITYPLKYLLPFRLWPPLPYSYRVPEWGSDSAGTIPFGEAYERFLAYVRSELGLPGVPDYYYLVADLMGEEPLAATQRLIRLMVDRDYAGLRRALLSRQAQD